MRSNLLKFAVLGALGALSLQAQAGWEPLPVTGFTAVAGTGQPTGGITPYKTCNPNGNFGSFAPIPSSSVCKAPVATTVIDTAPDSGYGTAIASSLGSLIMNNTFTGGVNKTVGTYQIRLFRNTTTNQCIFASQVVLNNTDYYTNNAEAVADGIASAAGTQTFEANGIAMGGYAGSGTVDISYNLSGNSETLFRAGRTFTSVQHRAASAVLNNTPAAGYYNLPLSSGTTYLASITGRESKDCCTPNPTLAQQSANLNDNWVEFTTDANALDPDGGTKPASPILYVRAACPTQPSLTPTPNATRARLTWQEQGNTYPQAFIEIPFPGFVPVGGAATPAPVVPF